MHDWVSGVIWHQLRDRNAVNTAIMPRTLLSCNQFYRGGGAGEPELSHVPSPWLTPKNRLCQSASRKQYAV